ncbi:MAG: TolC family protein [Elusimicrobia bacterium]|nr:TolC family protein [Elusimicrobiota bacterium]
MPFIGTLFAILLSFPPAAAEPAARPLTLDEAFSLAVNKSETLAAGGLGVKQLEAAERQFRSTLRPAVSGIASETLADASRGKAQAAINLNYSVYSGMRDYIAARASGLRTAAARLEQARARQNLYLGVAAAYINLAALQREVSARRAQLGVTAGRIKELEDRAAIGRSRKGEVLASKAQLAQEEASLAAALSEENSAQLELSFLTGLEGKVTPRELQPPALPDLRAHLGKAGTRFDVAAARRALEAAELDADARARLGWPALDLGANYYLKRPPSAQDSRWDAGLTLRVPLYSGGYNDAAAAEAGARASAAKLALDLAERAALTEVRQAHSALEHSLLVISSLEKALALAEDNAALQTKDYAYGLVTNLDVLSALNSALQTRLDLDQAKARAALAAERLKTAAGYGGETE